MLLPSRSNAKPRTLTPPDSLGFSVHWKASLTASPTSRAMNSSMEVAAAKGDRVDI
jgi:hypothetical protein